MVLSTDGSVLAIGDLADFNGARDGLSLGAIARFLPDGSRDTNFVTATFGGSDGRLLALPDGGFLAAGSVLVFSNALPARTSWPLSSGNNPVLRKGLARFSANGTLDMSFNVTFLGQGGTRGYSSQFVCDLLLQPDGRILVSGGFTNVNGSAFPGLVRLHPNGTIDSLFRPDIGGVAQDFAAIRSIALGPDGRVAVAIEDWLGSMKLICVQPGGAYDPAFGVHRATGTSSLVAVLASGDVLWGGNFVSVDGNRRYSLARFHSDGVLAPDGAVGLNRVTRSPDGRCQFYIDSRVAGPFRIESSSDLKTWTPVSNQAVGAGPTVLSRAANSARVEFFRASWP